MVSSTRFKLRTASYLLGTVILPPVVSAQADGPRLLDGVVAVHEAAGARAAAQTIWPGFRADTMPVQYVFAGEGVLLLGWRGELPDGYHRLEGVPGSGWLPFGDKASASFTVVRVGDVVVAQVPVREEQVNNLIGVINHERFHAFERSVARDGRLFGQGENSFLVTSYPIYNAANERGSVLEHRLLRAALLDPSLDSARLIAREYIALREARQRALPPPLAEFEIAAEMNEGLAEYALILTSSANRNEAQRTIADRLMALGDELTRSVRLRFYATGSGTALLIDRLEGDGWKSRMMEANQSLQEMLAEVSGYRRYESRIRDQGIARTETKDGQVEVGEALSRLRAHRRAEIDSLMRVPGLRVIVEGDASANYCGIDPQNLLAADSTLFLHRRWVKPCAGDRWNGEFNTPTVEDQTKGMWTAIAGPVSEVDVTVDGDRWGLADDLPIGAHRLQIKTSQVSIEVARGRMIRREGALVFVVEPQREP